MNLNPTIGFLFSKFFPSFSLIILHAIKASTLIRGNNIKVVH